MFCVQNKLVADFDGNVNHRKVWLPLQLHRFRDSHARDGEMRQFSRDFLLFGAQVTEGLAQTKLIEQSIVYFKPKKKLLLFFVTEKSHEFTSKHVYLNISSIIIVVQSFFRRFYLLNFPF